METIEHSLIHVHHTPEFQKCCQLLFAVKDILGDVLQTIILQKNCAQS